MSSTGTNKNWIYALAAAGALVVAAVIFNSLGKETADTLDQFK